MKEDEVSARVVGRCTRGGEVLMDGVVKGVGGSESRGRRAIDVVAGSVE